MWPFKFPTVFLFSWPESTTSLCVCCLSLSSDRTTVFFFHSKKTECYFSSPALNQTGFYFNLELVPCRRSVALGSSRWQKRTWRRLTTPPTSPSPTFWQVRPWFLAGLKFSFLNLVLVKPSYFIQFNHFIVSIKNVLVDIILFLTCTGFLAPETNSVDLPVGVHLELPLWAARVMCKPGRTYVSVNIPSGFKDAHR